MFTLLSHICLSLTGHLLPEGIIDDYFFYQLRSKKKLSDTLLDGIKQIGKHTPHQLAILGFPSDETRSCVEKIFYGKKFSDYFFKRGRPSHISILSDRSDRDVSVTLYFDNEESMFEAGQCIHHQGTHPQKGYKLVPRKIGYGSKCSHCGKFLPLLSEKYRLEPRRFANMDIDVVLVLEVNNCLDPICTACDMKSPII